MKLESLINKRVDVLGKFGTVTVIARGTLEEHPSGQHEVYLLTGLTTYDIQVEFDACDVERIDPHTDYPTKCTIYLKAGLHTTVDEQRAYEKELSKAPEWCRETLRKECLGDPTTVYAVLNDCITTRNPVLQDLLVQLHGEAQGMEGIDWTE